MTPDKKNDVNWCMQFVGLLLAVCFLIVGSFRVEGFLNSFLDYSQIYFGVCWLFIALIHRIKWLHKIELQEAKNMQDHLPIAESENAEQGWRNQQLTACEVGKFCVEGVERGKRSGNQVSCGFPQTFAKK